MCTYVLFGCITAGSLYLIQLHSAVLRGNLLFGCTCSTCNNCSLSAMK